MRFLIFRSKRPGSFLRALVVAVFTLGVTACGGGDDSGTFTLTATVFLNDPAYFGITSDGGDIEPMKPIGTSADVNSVWLYIQDDSDGVVQDWTELPFNSDLGAYTKGMAGFTYGTYQFTAEAYDSAGERAGTVIFENAAPTTKTITEADNSVTINLAVFDNGTPFAFPVVTMIEVDPNGIPPGASTTVTFTVGGAADEVLQWELSGASAEGFFFDLSGDPTVPITTGTFTIPNLQTTGTFQAGYTAPSAMGFFQKKIKLTNAGGDAVIVSFYIHVTLGSTNATLQTFLNPVIMNITGERLWNNDIQLTASVSDDKPVGDLSFTWSYNTALSHDLAITTSSNPANLRNYTPDSTGTITLALTDKDLGSTTVSILLPPDLFPDGISDLGPYAAVAMDGGGNHTCAVLSGGNIACWGQGINGKLGNGSLSDRSRQTLVAGIADAGGSISGGTNHSCAVVSDGIKCWGYNSQGQLGDDTTTQRDTPVYINGQEPALAVAVGGLHTCGLLTTGQLKCWGYNGNGQLGIGTTTRSLVPVGVTGITGTDAGTSASDITVGQNHSCAVMYDTGLAKNIVKCWGSNFDGQLGDGTTTQRLTPVIVKEYDDTTYTTTHTLVDVVAVSAGIYSTCALINDGKVRCWGSGSSGRLGNGANTPRPAAVAVSGIIGADAATTATAIAAGGDHACALMQNGTIKCWGAGGYGQIGNLADISKTTPVTVYGIGDPALANNSAIAVSAGGSHTCAVLAKGNMRCWGNNGFFQLGDGTNTQSNRPLGVDQLDYP